MLSTRPRVRAAIAVRTHLTAPTTADRWDRHRHPVALDGALFGSWAARIPDVAHRVGAGSGALGVALLCVSLGALVNMQLTGPLCARLGAGRVAAAAAAGACLAIALPGLTTSVPALSATLLLFGACTGRSTSQRTPWVCRSSRPRAARSCPRCTAASAWAG